MSCVAPMAAPLAIVYQIESDAKTVNDLSTIICGGLRPLKSSPAFAGEGDRGERGRRGASDWARPLHQASPGPPPPQMRGGGILRSALHYLVDPAAGYRMV